MNPTILKSYLIKLGVQVDNQAVGKLKDTVGRLTGLMTTNSALTARAALKSSGIVVSSLMAIDTAIVKNIQNVVEADLQYQLLGQKMFMTADAAKAFKLSSEALNASLFEIAWNAELKQRYFTLVNQINSLRTPPEARRMFREVRDIGFEFTKIKVSVTSALEHITYQLLRLNAGALRDLKKTVGDIADKFIKDIPEWSEKVAKWLDIPIKLSETGIRIVGNFFTVIKMLVGEFKSTWRWMTGGKTPSWIPELLAFLAVVTPIFVIGSPFLKGIAIFTASLFLIDDLLSHLRGEESLGILKPVWDLAEFLTTGFMQVVIAAMTLWDHFTWKLAHPFSEHPSGLTWQEDVVKNIRSYWQAAIDVQEEVGRNNIFMSRGGPPPLSSEEGGEDKPIPSRQFGTLIPSWDGIAKRGRPGTKPSQTDEGVGTPLIPPVKPQSGKEVQESTLQSILKPQREGEREFFVGLYEKMKLSSLRYLAASSMLTPQPALSPASAGGLQESPTNFYTEVRVESGADPIQIAAEIRRSLEQMIRDQKARERISGRYP